MDKDYWIKKLNIKQDSDVLFYQNPKFFRTNSFKRESLDKELDDTLTKYGKIKIYIITGITNNHHKASGNRLKIALVKEYLC